MIIINNIKMDISICEDDVIKELKEKYKNNDFKDIFIKKKSLDARKGNFKFVYTVGVETDNDEKFFKSIKDKNASILPVQKREIRLGEENLYNRPVITGFGPAGMFCALELAKYGYKPIIIERGDEIKKRDEKVNGFWKNGNLDTESNVQFGEGGAGTYSDGKLTTRINDPLCEYVLKTFHKFGAPDEILYKSKPHIGTDLLKNIVVELRQYIKKCGGEFYFRNRLSQIGYKDGTISSVKTQNNTFECNVLVLATGHSARDIYEKLYENNVSIIPKTFSVGVRIEHLQEELDKSLYKNEYRNPNLPKGEYQLSYRENDRGVYTFCMCPGGSVVASASEEKSIVTNGMSNYKRDGINANSALVVNVDSKTYGTKALDGMYFQRMLEKKAYSLAKGNYSAPCQLVNDFILNKNSKAFKSVNPSYTGETSFCDMNNLFSDDINAMMKKGLDCFGKKLSCFKNGEAVLTGPETRTSAPCRILRNESFESVDISGLYPCGEGAGYAGGIVSAAVDGIKVAEKIMEKYSNKLL